MRPSALCDAVGIRGSIHFNRHCLSPLPGKGLIVRREAVSVFFNDGGE